MILLIAMPFRLIFYRIRMGLNYYFIEENTQNAYSNGIFYRKKEIKKRFILFCYYYKDLIFGF